MMRVDLNCLLGHWPFRKLRNSSFQDLQEIHQRSGISYGYVASLNSIFYNDPYEGEEELHALIRHSNYRHVLTLNPTLPYFKQDLARGLQELNIKAVRIYPTYHGYDLDKKELALLMGELARHHLPLFLTLRLEDERLNYPLPIQQLSLDKITDLARAHPSVPIVLLSPLFAEATQLMDQSPGLPNVYFDTSSLGHHLFPLEKLADKIGSERLVYGSGFPLKALRSSVLQIEQADLAPGAARQIFCNDAVMARLES